MRFRTFPILFLTPRFFRSASSEAIATIVSFPGIALQEIMQKLMCMYYNIPMYKREHTFSIEENYENMPHFNTYTPWQAVSIMLLPFLISSCICALLTIPCSISFQAYHIRSIDFNITELMCTWIGITTGLYAVPTEKDLDTILELTTIKQSNMIANLSMYIIMTCSVPCIGFLCRIGYVALLMHVTSKPLI